MIKLEFTDEDIKAFQAFSNGVLIECAAESFMDATDDHGQSALLFNDRELQQLVDATNAPQDVYQSPAAYISYSLNKAEIHDAMLIFDATAVEHSVAATSAFVFVPLTELKNVLNSLLSEQERLQQGKDFEKAFTRLAGKKLSVSDSSNIVIAR